MAGSPPSTRYSSAPPRPACARSRRAPSGSGRARGRGSRPASTRRNSFRMRRWPKSTDVLLCSARKIEGSGGSSPRSPVPARPSASPPAGRPTCPSGAGAGAPRRAARGRRRGRAAPRPARRLGPALRWATMLRGASIATRSARSPSTSTSGTGRSRPRPPRTRPRRSAPGRRARPVVPRWAACRTTAPTRMPRALPPNHRRVGRNRGSARSRSPRLRPVATASRAPVAVNAGADPSEARPAASSGAGASSENQ